MSVFSSTYCTVLLLPKSRSPLIIWQCQRLVKKYPRLLIPRKKKNYFPFSFFLLPSKSSCSYFFFVEASSISVPEKLSKAASNQRLFFLPPTLGNLREEEEEEAKLFCRSRSGRNVLANKRIFEMSLLYSPV